jgi:Tfp pilus assembly protein PilF|tara:strand:+ start:1747 stop:2166 length:420 start_codon:yes stop_codon:yes gene_type:complete
MKKVFKITLLIFLLSNPLYGKNEYLQEGINLFKIKKFEEAKFKFEKDIVFNPKSELSYLYLSKIFKNLDKKELQELNLNTVILINPNNEEAIFNLAKLKLENSDYKKSEKLNDKLNSLCEKFCKESKKLQIEIDNLSKK